MGPAGSGKTRLALQWALEQDGPTQYVSGRSLNDLQSNIPEAIFAEPNAFGQALADMLNELLIEIKQPDDGRMQLLFQHLVMTSQQERNLLIVDDLELIGPGNAESDHSSFIQALSNFQIEQALLLSRIVAPGGYQTLKNMGNLRVVPPASLQFNAREAAEAHSLGKFGTASLEQVLAARNSAHGWIAGMLTELHGHGGDTIETAQFRTSVLNNLVLHQPPQILQTMIAAAFLPFNTMGIWERWFTHLGIPHWAIPSTLTQLPTRSIPQTPGRFEIVPAMSSALREIRNLNVSDDNLHELLAIAIDWHISNNDPASAASLASEHGLESEFLRLIKPVALKLSREEDWDEIARLVEALPVEVIASDVDISFWYSFALASATRWSEVIDIQYRVADQWSASESPLTRGRLQLKKGFFARAKGDYQEALDHFEQAYNTLPQSSHQERMYAAASAETSTSQIRLDPQASVWRNRTAFELAHLPPKQRWWHGNMGPIALGYVASSGRLQSAYTQAEQQVTALKEDGPELSWRYLLLMAQIDIERLRFDSAAEVLEQAQPYVNTPLQQQMLMLVESKLLAAQGNYTSAMQKLNFRPYSAGRSINNEFIQKLAMAAQAFDSGDVATADIALGSAAWPNDPWPRNFGDSHPNLILALVRAETGEIEQGLNLANQVLEEAKDRRFRSLEVRSHVVLAYIYWQNGSIKDQHREMHAATTRNAHAGYELVFFVKGQDLREAMDTSTVVAPNNPVNRLTSREIEVLGLVAQSFSNKQIAEAMYISVSTVKNHLTSVYDKLGTNNRRAAVQLARKYGFVDRHHFL